MMASVETAVGVIVQNRRVLLAERPSHKPYSGYWEFPGGKIEPGESSEQALRRELKEELGIDVVAMQYLFEHSHIYPDKKVRLDIYTISKFTGSLEGQEGQQLKWLMLDDVAHYNLLPGNWPIVDQLKRLFAPENS